MLSYWRNNRDRILGQMTVWFSNGQNPDSTKEDLYGAIIPQVKYFHLACFSSSLLKLDS